MWGVLSPHEAKEIIESQITSLNIQEPRNLEEQALLLVGPDIYYRLIKGYTEKQWGKPATELPSFIIKRIPLRFTYNNNYFNSKYQGIPIGGYTQIIEKMLSNVEVKLNTNFFNSYRNYRAIAKKLVFTGMIDEFFEYEFGPLDYRSLSFETEVLDTPNFQGNAVVNYCDFEVPYTRIIEHKHFESDNQEKTVITREYPKQWEVSDEPYYCINDNRNTKLLMAYKNMALDFPDIIFGGRLGSYQYYNMDEVIGSALACVSQELEAESKEYVSNY
jgi:UDP-galactopyranose mutase